MSAIREEELNLVNGGTLFGLLGEDPPHKFNQGDHVICENYNYARGVVMIMCYAYDQWYYSVRLDHEVNGKRLLLCRECELKAIYN